MEERVTKKLKTPIGAGEGEPFEFTLTEGPFEGSSASAKVEASSAATAVDSASVEEIDTAAAEYSPEFLELAIPKLPELEKENRARLLMQSPNKLYFYWSVGKNPYHTLNRALGAAANYTLVLKLVNTRTEAEEIHPADAAGNWWFDVDSDAEYRAEIGFYAVNRPYIRVMYSNSVSTPRKAPSTRNADAAEWRVPAQRFARVLDAAGYKRDAFDVALAGDDINTADAATRSAFAQFTGRRYNEFESLGASEIRYAMLALASGVTLRELNGLVSRRLFDLLASALGVDQPGAQTATRDRAMSALREKFEFEAEDFEIDEDESEPVFGGSLVGFPRKLRKRGLVPDLGPVSSLNTPFRAD